MERSILHMDMDTFFVECERRENPGLINKPVLVGGTGSRGIVSACSYETRPYGIHSGMSMPMAKRMCPEALIIKGNSMVYTKYSKLVTDIIGNEVPVFEKSSIDEFYIDLTGMDRYFGTYKFAKQLRQKIIDNTGLPISFGLSQNKVVSKVATGEAKPNNQMRIDLGYERSFLAPLPIRKIPSVGKVSASRLRDLGIHMVKSLQSMPKEVIHSVLGKNGLIIWERANGIDTRPITPYSERKSISRERTYEGDTANIESLKATLTAMGESLAFQLRMDDRLASCVSVKIKYSDFSVYSKQGRLSYTSADHLLIPKILELFEKLYERRLLIRLVGVRFSDLVGGHYQINLFDDDSKRIGLYTAMDRMRQRFGASCLMRASTMDVKSVRSNRNPFNGEPPIVLAHRRQ
ncbi:DNA-directed DNA polymerase [Flagellimonas maritima]|uniref:DNA polymerase IV n=1 Tax=Flagellimonas maritima TaxID=1383885 RepID=A0A2Z4LTW9_9FLAO|nr:DNA polymerase IV [Allomuricauda aurantiaca]AWX44808.1 DNA-directed DNA polymerase [Allomuricauda aurantiaca]